MSAQFIFDLEQVVLVILRDEIDSQTQVSKSSRSTDSVQICLGETRKVKVDDDIDRLDINTSSKDVCTDKTSRFPILEVMINSASVVLLHF